MERTKTKTSGAEVAIALRHDEKLATKICTYIGAPSYERVNNGERRRDIDRIGDTRDTRVIVCEPARGSETFPRDRHALAFLRSDVLNPWLG